MTDFKREEPGEQSHPAVLAVRDIDAWRVDAGPPGCVAGVLENDHV